MDGDLYQIGLDLIIRRYVPQDEMHEIPKVSHDGTTENFRGEISPMGYFAKLFSKKIFTNLHFLKPPFAQFSWGKFFLL